MGLWESLILTSESVSIKFLITKFKISDQHIKLEGLNTSPCMLCPSLSSSLNGHAVYLGVPIVCIAVRCGLLMFLNT